MTRIKLNNPMIGRSLWMSPAMHADAVHAESTPDPSGHYGGASASSLESLLPAGKTSGPGVSLLDLRIGGEQAPTELDVGEPAASGDDDFAASRSSNVPTERGLRLPPKISARHPQGWRLSADKSNDEVKANSLLLELESGAPFDDDGRCAREFVIELVHERLPDIADADLRAQVVAELLRRARVAEVKPGDGQTLYAFIDATLDDGRELRQFVELDPERFSFIRPGDLRKPYAMLHHEVEARLRSRPVSYLEPREGGLLRVEDRGFGRPSRDEAIAGLLLREAAVREGHHPATVRASRYGQVTDPHNRTSYPMLRGEYWDDLLETLDEVADPELRALVLWEHLDDDWARGAEVSCEGRDVALRFRVTEDRGVEPGPNSSYGTREVSLVLDGEHFFYSPTDRPQFSIDPTLRARLRASTPFKRATGKRHHNYPDPSADYRAWRARQ